jgi:hypothetical protein
MSKHFSRRSRCGADLPALRNFIEFDLECRNRANRGGFYSPDSASAIIKDVCLCQVSVAIINAIPPSPRFAPPRDDAMNVKEATFVDELDRLAFRGKYARRSRDGRHGRWGGNWLFEHMFER